MTKTSSRRPSLWFAVLAVFVAAAVWATVAMAAGGSGSSSTSSTPVYAGPHTMFAASGGTHAAGDCPNMGGSNGGSSTTPSTQGGSSNSGL